MSMLPHQQRVQDEAVELTERIAKLTAFFRAPTFAGLPYIEQELLRDQLTAMTAYQRALAMRLSMWSVAP